jgi:hypothetical protein
MTRRNAFAVVAFAAALLAAACGGSPSQPSPGPGAGAPLPPPTLGAPVPDNPDPDEQLTSTQPELRVGNAASDQAGAKSYHFQVSSTDDFSAVVVEAQNVAEGPGATTWTVSPPLQPNTIYWWRSRATQGTATGPWSGASRFKSKIEGYNLPGELFDPLTNGTSIGSRAGGLTFLPEGVRLDGLGSRIRYALMRTMSSGEFSVQATGLDNNSAGESTKLFSMQQGSDLITTNPYRATIEKRANGTVSFRLIAGNPDTRADADRREVTFSPSKTYLWRFTWGGGTARLVIFEGDEQGPVVFNNAKSYGGTYLPNPHIAHLGAPPARDGLIDASTPGAIIRNVWISNRPRPAGLGALNAQ